MAICENHLVWNIVSGLAAVLLSFFNAEGEDFLTLISVISGVVGIILLARSQLLNRALTPVIELALDHTTDLAIQDYTKVLGLQSEYRVAEVEINEDEWLANDTAKGLDLSDEGVILLGIERNGDYIGAPGPDTEIRPGDTVVLYGKKIDYRKSPTETTGRLRHTVRHVTNMKTSSLNKNKSSISKHIYLPAVSRISP